METKTQAGMYLDVGLCGVVVGLVLEIERVEPLIQ